VNKPHAKRKNKNLCPRIVRLAQPEAEALNQILAEGYCATETGAMITPSVLGRLVSKGLVRPVVAWQVTFKGSMALRAFGNRKVRKKK